MIEHTPGPWRVCGLHIASSSEVVVATCHKDNYHGVVRPKNEDECLANARLISLAPEMYEILSDIVDGKVDRNRIKKIIKRRRLPLNE